MGCILSEADCKPRIPVEVISLEGKPGTVQGKQDEEGEARQGWNFRGSPRLCLIPWGPLDHNTQNTRVGLFYSPICQRLAVGLSWEM